MSEKGTQLPLGTRKAQPDLAKFDELSDDDLDQIMAGLKPDPTVEKEEEPEPEPDTMDEPEPEPEEEEEEAKDEEPEEEAEEEDDEPEQADEPAAEELSPLEKRLALLERRLQLEALERERESEARKRAEMLASKQAGRAGYLQQQLKEKAKAKPTQSEAAGASDDLWDDDESQSPAVERQEQPATDPGLELDDTRRELITIAINDEGNKFAQDNAEELEDWSPELLDKLQERIREEAAPFASEFASSSMATVRKLARSCMNSALASLASERVRAEIAEATTRKAESVEKSRRRKKKAAISTTGRRSAPPAPKAQKSYDEMDLDELEAEMKKEFGENYRIGPRNGL